VSFVFSTERYEKLLFT